MTEDIVEVTRSDLVQTAIAAGIIIGSLVVAWVVAVIAEWLLRRVTLNIPHSPADALVRALRRPVVLLVALQGVFIGLWYPNYMEPYRDHIERVWLALVVLIVIFALTRGVTQWFNWYQSQPERQMMRTDPRALPLLRRGINLTIAVLGGLLILDVVGLEITPLIAGLGIGGLAVALALQPLLGNIFASSYMLSDASLRVGDFVEVDGGPVGVVEHIGWRATRIRSFDNNIVLMPNSKLADSIFTNYSSTDLQADARLTFGVAYEEDLQRVEDVVTDELVQLRDEFEASVKDYEPIVRFQEFDDSNITVLVKLRALTWGDSFMLRHLMVKRIHERLGAEGIVINYPARRLIMQHDDIEGLDRLMRRAEELREDAVP